MQLAICYGIFAKGTMLPFACDIQQATIHWSEHLEHDWLAAGWLAGWLAGMPL
jgi:hypothetical protein